MSEAWNSKVSDSGLFYMCSKLFSAAQSENSSQSIGILHQLCFQNNYSMLSINNKIGRFVKLILFAELALPSWLRHILCNRFDSSLPVTEVMIFIPIIGEGFRLIDLSFLIEQLRRVCCTCKTIPSLKP